MATIEKTRRLIGTYVLETAKVFQELFECAAWYRNIEVQPGEYPVTTDGYWIFVKLDGVIVSDNFQSLFAGMPIGKPYDREQNKGEAAGYTIQTQAYAVRDNPRYKFICGDCQDGEHENYDDNVRETTVREPGTNKLFKSGFMCGEHREMYASDGYKVHA